MVGKYPPSSYISIYFQELQRNEIRMLKTRMRAEALQQKDISEV